MNFTGMPLDTVEQCEQAIQHLLQEKAVLEGQLDDGTNTKAVLLSDEISESLVRCHVVLRVVKQRKLAVRIPKQHYHELLMMAIRNLHGDEMVNKVSEEVRRLKSLGKSASVTTMALETIILTDHKRNYRTTSVNRR